MLLQAQSNYRAGYRVFVTAWHQGAFFIDPGDGHLYPFSSCAPLRRCTPAEFKEQGFVYTTNARPPQEYIEITDKVYSGEYDAVASTT